jgi:hypothetical protein
MYAVFQPELVTVHFDGLAARQPPADVVWIGFEDEGAQSALGQVQRRAETGNAAANYNDVIARPRRPSAPRGRRPETGGRSNLLGIWFTVKLDVAVSLLRGSSQPRYILTGQ